MPIFSKKSLFSCFLVFVFFAGNQAFSATSDYYDLYAKEMTVQPEYPRVGEKAIITIRVRNEGDKNIYTTTGIHSFSYSFPGFDVTKIDYTSPTFTNYIIPRGYITYTIEGKFSQSGDIDLAFTVDSDNELDESAYDEDGYYVSYEDNNSISKQISVGDVDEVDINIKSITYDPEDFLIGDTVTLAVEIENTGSSSITSGLGLTKNDVAATLYNFQMNSKTTDALPTFENPLDPGETFKVYYNGVFTREGAYVFIFNIDKNKTLSESNELNNASSTPIELFVTSEAKDDFEILDFSSVFVSSSSVKVSWTTDKATDGKVIYEEKTHDNPDIETSLSSDKTKHEITISGLEPDTFYYYKIKANSISDVVTKESEFKTFVTPRDDAVSFRPEPDLTLIGNQATISWSNNLLAKGYVYYKTATSVDYLVTSSDDYLIDHEFVLSDLDKIEYHYYVAATSTVDTSARTDIKGFNVLSGERLSITEEAAGEAAEETATTTAIETITAPTPTPAPTPTTSSKKSEIREVVPRIIASRGSATFERLKGRIVLKVEAHGESWYLNAEDEKKYFLGRPSDAFRIMRDLGVGITNADLEKIPQGDIFTPFDQRGKWDLDFTFRQLGKIFLQVEENGEAWYVNPADSRRYFLGRPIDAFNVMRELSIGISNENFLRL